MSTQAKEKTVKELVESIQTKLGDRLTFDEEMLLDSLPHKLDELSSLKKVETLYYDKKHLDAFNKAIELTEKSTRTRNTSITTKESGENFEVNVTPTTLGFLADVFVFFGREIYK